MKQYFVNYSIGIRAYQAGPYASYDEAEIHEKDIRSYAGIKECFVAEYRNPLRTLIGEEATAVTKKVRVPEHCQTCGQTDREYSHTARICPDPWHADDRLRRATSVTNGVRAAE